MLIRSNPSGGSGKGLLPWWGWEKKLIQKHITTSQLSSSLSCQEKLNEDMTDCTVGTEMKSEDSSHLKNMNGSSGEVCCVLRTILGSGDMERNKTQYLASRRSQSSDMYRKSDILISSHGHVSPQHLLARATSPELRTSSAWVSDEAGSTQVVHLPSFPWICY